MIPVSRSKQAGHRRVEEVVQGCTAVIWSGLSVSSPPLNRGMLCILADSLALGAGRTPQRRLLWFPRFRLRAVWACILCPCVRGVKGFPPRGRALPLRPSRSGWPLSQNAGGCWLSLIGGWWPGCAYLSQVTRVDIVHCRLPV